MFVLCGMQYAKVRGVLRQKEKLMVDPIIFFRRCDFYNTWKNM